MKIFRYFRPSSREMNLLLIPSKKDIHPITKTMQQSSSPITIIPNDL